MCVRSGLVVDVWWADLRSADIRLTQLLDANENARLQALVVDADRGRFLVGAALLRAATAAATGASASSITIDRTCAECGEPHGAPRVDGTRVSVAHASSLVLVATAARAVGVDVESVDRGGDVEQWVADEAIFKTGARGEPVVTVQLSVPMPSFHAALAVVGEGESQVVVHDVEESATALRALLAVTP